MLLTVPNAAKALGIGERTLRAYISRGDLPIIRLSPGCVRIEQAALESYVRAREWRSATATGNISASSSKGDSTLAGPDT